MFKTATLVECATFYSNFGWTLMIVEGYKKVKKECVLLKEATEKAKCVNYIFRLQMWNRLSINNILQHKSCSLGSYKDFSPQYFTTL